MLLLQVGQKLLNDGDLMWFNSMNLIRKWRHREVNQLTPPHLLSLNPVGRKLRQSYFLFSFFLLLFNSHLIELTDRKIKNISVGETVGKSLWLTFWR